MSTSVYEQLRTKGVAQSPEDLREIDRPAWLDEELGDRFQVLQDMLREKGAEPASLTVGKLLGLIGIASAHFMVELLGDEDLQVGEEVEVALVLDNNNIRAEVRDGEITVRTSIGVGMIDDFSILYTSGRYNGLTGCITAKKGEHNAGYAQARYYTHTDNFGRPEWQDLGFSWNNPGRYESFITDFIAEQLQLQDQTQG